MLNIVSEYRPSAVKYLVCIETIWHCNKSGMFSSLHLRRDSVYYCYSSVKYILYNMWFTMVTYAISEKSTVVFGFSQNNMIIFSEIVVIKINTKALKRWIRILLVVQHNQYLSLFNTSKVVIN